MKSAIPAFLLVLLFSCTTKTKIDYDSKDPDPRPPEYVAFRDSVQKHYASIGVGKKIGNAMFEDKFLESHIRIIEKGALMPDTTFIDLGTISGRCRRANYEWMIYKMKKTAIENGANGIIEFDSVNYTNDHFWRDLLSKDTITPTPMVRCSGKVVFIR